VPRKNIKTIVVKPRLTPTPIAKPRIDSQLTQRHPIERAAIILTYWCLKAEHFVSPGGSLREWFRLNAYVALFVAVPTFIIVPIITVLLTQFVTWTALLARIIKNLIMAQCLGMVCIGLLVALYVALKLFLSRLSSSAPR
jgi:hypothetical protein